MSRDTMSSDFSSSHVERGTYRNIVEDYMSTMDSLTAEFEATLKEATSSLQEVAKTLDKTDLKTLHEMTGIEPSQDLSRELSQGSDRDDRDNRDISDNRGIRGVSAGQGGETSDFTRHTGGAKQGSGRAGLRLFDR